MSKCQLCERGNRMRAEILAMNMFLLGFAALSAARAQEPAALTEPERMRQCDRDACGIITNPSAEGAPLQCDIGQTWYKDDIARVVKKGRLSWPFGDARCTAKFEIGRALFAAPLKAATHTLKIPPQPVACEIDNAGARHVVSAKMGPVIEFENGKAKSVSLGIADIEGTAVIRNVVWAAWKFESTFGYFQADFVKAVNEYIIEHCPTRTD
jgi:hypothetical protein